MRDRLIDRLASYPSLEELNFASFQRVIGWDDFQFVARDSVSNDR